MSLYSSNVRCLVMGVLNVTPDSFFDGGRYLDHDDAITRGVEILDEGADIVDIGGESTRPGASPVPEAEELHRVLPVVAALAQDDRVRDGRARISIDTTKPSVARAAVAAGASLVNDVSPSGGMAAVAAETGAGLVVMHAQGAPDHMQDDPRYEDVVAEVSGLLRERAEAAEGLGVAEVWVDPGIGFGKTARHNLALLAELPAIVALGWPVLVGTSRKTFLGRIAAGGPDSSSPRPTSERFEGSLASAVWSMTCGVRAVRVHDVRATRDAARLCEAAGAGR